MLNIIAAATMTVTIPCGPDASLIKALSQDFNERVVWIGNDLDNKGRIILFESPEGSSTIVTHGPNGQMCVVLVGKDGTDVR